MCAIATLLAAWTWRIEILGFVIGIVEGVVGVGLALAELAATVMIMILFLRYFVYWLFLRLQVLFLLLAGAAVFGGMMFMGLADMGSKLPRAPHAEVR